MLVEDPPLERLAHGRAVIAIAHRHSTSRPVTSSTTLINCPESSTTFFVGTSIGDQKSTLIRKPRISVVSTRSRAGVMTCKSGVIWHQGVRA